MRIFTWNIMVQKISYYRMFYCFDIIFKIEKEQEYLLF